MKQILLAAVFIALSSSSYAFELQTLGSADIKAAEITVPAAAPAVSAEKQYQNLWMSVFSNPSWKEAQANDYSAGIEVRVRKVFDTMFNADVRVDMKSEWLSINKFGSGFSLSGSGTNLNMNEWGGNFNISGSVTGDDNQTKFINLTLFKVFDGYSYNVSGMGMNMSVSCTSINGSYDDKEYSKKAMAAIVTLALTAQVDKMPAQKSASRDVQRIWLSIRPSMGWNTVEASDPFSGIKVGLRKAFNDYFDAEIEVDNDRENGSISHFFSDTYEYRSSRSNLKLEEWGGTYTLEGEVYVKGNTPEMVKVKLDMRDTFGGGAFSVSEQGLRLMIDRRGINGEVDTKVYPKKLVAIIAALAMSVQQQFPQNGN
ncbi:MAG: hypothetical protein Q7R35_01130 [Elusimicrobiota bacterium]|nr:hypothetical protein [Elusimicrobiota bacterium]